ncbi:Ms5788A family Cys-rich leader peptide [Micromonospora echinospora]
MDVGGVCPTDHRGPPRRGPSPAGGVARPAPSCSGRTPAAVRAGGSRPRLWREPRPEALLRRPGCWSGRWQEVGTLVGSVLMGTLLTKRRAVDLCRVATCLCRSVI